MAFTVYSIGCALLLFILALLLLGAWPAVWKYLDIKGKKPTHTFIDYGVAYAVVGGVASIVGGCLEYAGGTKPSFKDQITIDSGPLAAFAVFCGVALGIGDLLLQYAIVYIGVTLAPSISSSMVNVVAIVLSYFTDQGLNDPTFVFTGLACSVLAIILGAVTQFVHERTTGEVNHVDDKFKEAKDIKLPDTDAGDDGTASPAPEAGPTAATKRAVMLGLALSIVSGVLTGLFIPAFSVACNDPFKMLRPGQQPMSLYVASMYMTIAVGITAVSINVVLLYKPVPGTPRSSITEYFKDNQHKVASLGAGTMVTLSNVLQFAGGQ